MSEVGKRGGSLVTLLAGAVMIVMVAGCPPGKKPPWETSMITIPQQTFTMGLGDNLLKCGDKNTPEIEHCDSGFSHETKTWIPNLTFVPKLRATVAKFRIDEHEVTNAQYKYCEELGECSPPLKTDVNGIEYYGVEDYDDHPVVWVSWKQADTYCRFLGKRLPTEAQWEIAARIGEHSKLWTYPWKDLTPSSCSRGSFYAVATGCTKLPMPYNYSTADKTFAQVRNMASNVAEWVHDAWNTWAYCEGKQPYSTTCQDQGTACSECIADGSNCAASCAPTQLVLCKGGTYWPEDPTNSPEKVIRGGDYRHSRCFHRLYVRRMAKQATEWIGFRCRGEVRD